MEKQWFGLRELKARYHCSDMTIHRRVRNPDLGFPQPVYFGRIRHWDSNEIEAWEARQKAKSREAVASETANGGSEEAETWDEDAAKDSTG